MITSAISGLPLEIAIRILTGTAELPLENEVASSADPGIVKKQMRKDAVMRNLTRRHPKQNKVNEKRAVSNS